MLPECTVDRVQLATQFWGNEKQHGGEIKEGNNFESDLQHNNHLNRERETAMRSQTNTQLTAMSTCIHQQVSSRQNR
jgi:hypothetical protein